MIRTDQHVTTAPADIVFRVAADVERWPEILPHYRWVRFEQQRGFGRGVVEMAAWRDFVGPLRWPTWWKSLMEADPDEPIVRYSHIGGVTTGMDVEWLFLPADRGTVVRIVHEWAEGPAWPLIGKFAANRVIGPHFVSFIAQRTLKGVCAEAERLAALEAGEAAQHAEAGQPEEPADG
ncbi:MAG: SRPBCC family protein [Candidatus Longimicrobiales bacterium M2_2A_002]